MVRAAAAGVIDYTRADPKDINWKLRHRVLLYEMQRKEESQLLDAVHRHWLTYVLKPNLTPESAASVKNHANDALRSIQATIFPWWETESDKTQKDTIDVTPDIVERYKQFHATLQQQNQKQSNG